jgi:hypothetical protein
VPEALAAHVHFLYGLRREAIDNAIHLSGHAVRLRWPDGYLSKVTLAGRRLGSRSWRAGDGVPSLGRRHSGVRAGPVVSAP